MLKAASITLMTAGIDKLVHTPANDPQLIQMNLHAYE